MLFICPGCRKTVDLKEIKLVATCPLCGMTFMAGPKHAVSWPKLGSSDQYMQDRKERLERQAQYEQQTAPKPSSPSVLDIAMGTAIGIGVTKLFHHD